LPSHFFSSLSFPSLHPTPTRDFRPPGLHEKYFRRKHARKTRKGLKRPKKA
jgi:aminoglycoside phosphotransferase (APT) family kinase protein